MSLSDVEALVAAGSGADREVSFRVMSEIPLIVRDPRDMRRRVIAARWGFPDPKDWRRPQPIHARAETIERLPTFAPAFLSGMRGIALVKTFNEAPNPEISISSRRTHKLPASPSSFKPLACLGRG